MNSTLRCRGEQPSRAGTIAIKRSNTGTATTEVHVLSRASNLQTYILHGSTALHPTDQSFAFDVTDWNSDGKLDVVAVKKSKTGSGKTEAHVLSLQ